MRRLRWPRPRRCAAGSFALATRSLRLRKAAYLAVENGQLQALQCLFERRGNALFESYMLADAARLGHPRRVGHVAIVEFLAGIRTRRPGATKTSCELLELLLEFCPATELVNLGENGQQRPYCPEMAQVSVMSSSVECRVKALVKAAREKRCEIVEVILAHSDQATYQRALPQIAACAMTDIAELVLGGCDHITIANVVAGAAAGGSVVLAERLLSEMDAYSITRALTCAAARGHAEVVEVLLERSDASAVNFALSGAAMEGRVEVVELRRDRCDQVSHGEALARATAAGYFDVVHILQHKKVMRQ